MRKGTIQIRGAWPGPIPQMCAFPRLLWHTGEEEGCVQFHCLTTVTLHVSLTFLWSTKSAVEKYEAQKINLKCFLAAVWNLLRPHPPLTWVEAKSTFDILLSRSANGSLFLLFCFWQGAGMGDYSIKNIKDLLDYNVDTQSGCSTCPN